MMNVAYITNASPTSGVGHRTQKIKEVIQRRHHSQCQLTEYSLDGVKHELTREGEVLLRQHPLPGILGSKTVSWIRLGRRLQKRLHHEKTHTLWHATNQSLSFLLSNNVPSVVTVHDIIELLEPQTTFGAYAASYLYRNITRASQIITVSNYTAQTLQDHLHIPAEKITVIPNGVGSKFHPIEDFRQSLAFHTLSQELKLTSDNQVILYVGSDHPRKNIITALRAAAHVMQHNPHAVFLKVGEPGIRAGRAALLTTIDELGIRDRVHLLGNVSVEQLNELYNLAAVFIYPSRFEGFGLPPLQAMAAGTPVITSNATSLPEVVGEAAIMHNPDDVAAFTTSLNKILADSSEASRLRTLGLQRAKQFTWEAAAAAELEVYKKVI